jgi:hypothetical protein
MEAFYKLASQNPGLTFLLVAIIASTVYYIVDAIASAIRGRKK